MRKRVDPADYPRLTRFYGIPPSELEQMPNALLLQYAEQLPILHAEEVLLALAVSDAPHLDQESRVDLYEQFEHRAGVEREAPAAIDHTTDAGKGFLAGLGIAVEVESEDA